MANIIAVLNPKGGCGKTTIALHLARALNDNGATLLVDSDPQGSARDWAEQAGGDAFPVVGVDRAGALKNTVHSLMGGYEWVIIDGAAKLEDMGAHAIAASHMVIIPVQPSPLDLWSCETLVAQIKQRQVITDGAPLAVFQITRAKKGTQLAAQMRGVVSDYELPLFDGVIHDRTLFARSLTEGGTVIDAQPSGPAAWEIQHMTKQVMEAFNAQS